MPNGRHAGPSPIQRTAFDAAVYDFRIPTGWDAHPRRRYQKARQELQPTRHIERRGPRKRAPLGASRERIEAFVKRNSAWIISRLAQREQRQATAREPLSPSSIIALWGKPITVQDALDHNFASPAPRPKQATFASFMGTDEPSGCTQAKQRTALDDLTPDELQARIDQLYATEVTTALYNMVHAYEIAMGVTVARVSVRSMKTRWGSCTPKTGAIRIARELAAYPIECLDMVVAHELVHLLEPSHNQRFHALLDTYCPNNKALSQRLKQPPLNKL